MRDRVRVGDRALVDEVLARTRAFASSVLAAITVSEVSIFGAYQIKPTDDVVLAFGGAYPITLPAAAKGRQVTVKDASGNASTENKTILPSGTATIDGDPSFVLNLNSAAVELTSDGMNWYVTGTYNGAVV